MAAPAAPPANLRPSAVEEILGKGKNVLSQATSAVGSSFTPATGNFALNVLFYLVFYAFILFLVLVLVHYTYTPIFRFVPGGKGFIGVPGSTDDKVYWNDRKQPLPAARAPLEEDSLATYKFDNNFTVSIDILVRKLATQDSNSRLVLVKAARPDVNGNYLFNTAPTGSTLLKDYMKDKSSMIIYLSETNDLNVVFFSGSNRTEYACRPIKNIPLYQPFRITVVVEDKVFTVFLNGKQTFQRIVPEGISSPDLNQRFYAPPAWAEQPTKTIFLQNLHIWPRAITVPQVQQATPALATIPDFDAPKEAEGGSCY